MDNTDICDRNRLPISVVDQSENILHNLKQVLELSGKGARGGKYICEISL